MKWWITVVAAVLVTFLVVSGSAPASAAPGGSGESGSTAGSTQPGPAEEWELPSPTRPPLSGDLQVVRSFDPPKRRWQAGHRGVDLAAPVGSKVMATAAGRITFAGQLAGRGVMVVDHGAVRTTYEPVMALRRVGDEVRGGDVIGRLEPGHDCRRPGVNCLHLGLRRGEAYLDPGLLLGLASPVRLLPADARAGVRARARQREEAAAAAAAVAGDGPAPPPGTNGFIRPAVGPITSRFGMRLHPVLGVWKLHDGLDFGSGCGTPLRSIAAGRVTQAYYNGGYGNRLFIDHGTVNGRRVESSYNHAIRYSVHPGQQVGAGQVVGQSGSTGYSTGCHLHFMLWVDGQLVNPERWL